MKGAAISGRTVWVWLLVLLAFRFLAGAILPITTDEAYYAIWSSKLAWGYFDHPPVVALAGWLRTVFSPAIATCPLLARFTVLLASSVVVPWAIARMAQRLGMRNGAFAAFLFCATFAGLAGGMLLTPDAFLLVAWAVALPAATQVFDALTIKSPPPGQKSTAGFPLLPCIACGSVFGLGMLSKYTFALMPLIFTWMLLASKSMRVVALKRRLAALTIVSGTAVMVFSPHVLWNARNDWATFGFQLRRGFAGEHGAAPREDGFAPPPLPVRLPYSRLDSRLADFFTSYDAMTAKLEEVARVTSARREKSKLEQRLTWFSGYVSAQVSAAGFMLPVALFIFWQRRKHRREQSRSQLQDSALTLTRLAAWVPFVFFGVLAPLTKVEANWPVAGFIGFAILAARRTGFESPAHPDSGIAMKRLMQAGLINASILLAIALIGANPALRSTISEKPDRISEETTGFPALADFVASSWKRADTPLFVDKYQWAAMVKFHRPDAAVQQIRGITRDSEFTRAGKWQPVDLVAFQKMSSLSLLTSDDRPPRFEGFAPTGAKMLCTMPDGKLAINGVLVESGKQNAGNPAGILSCQRRLFLYSYRPW